MLSRAEIKQGIEDGIIICDAGDELTEVYVPDGIMSLDIHKHSGISIDELADDIYDELFKSEISGSWDGVQFESDFRTYKDMKSCNMA